AGKSSLLKAGLVPAVRRGALPFTEVVVLAPGADPVKELGRVLPGLEWLCRVDGEESGADVRRAVAAHADGPVLVVVDQFEEAFTLCTDPEQRLRFLRALVAAASSTPDGPAPAVVVCGLRADFYGACLDHPELVAALQERQMVLGPMNLRELENAVAAPARAVGLQLEPGLVDRLMADLGVRPRHARAPGQGPYDAGALPLLSHALRATWQRRQQGRLVLAGYHAAGGIHGSVAATAERVWADLAEPARATARVLLLRLVRVAADSQDTRRRVARTELLDRPAAPAVLEALVHARLVTAHADTVELTHEALLSAWPRLRSFIDEDRAANLVRQRLEEDARAWVEDDRDDSALYRGARLENARQRTSPDWPGTLSDRAREFLAASARHHRRSLWARRAVALAAVVCAVVASVVAVVVVDQRDDARSRQLVAEADGLRQTDPSLAALLTLRARQLRPDDLTVHTRLLGTQHTPLATSLTGHAGAVYAVALGTGSTLATAGYDRTVRLWDVHDRAHPVPAPPLTGHGGAVRAIGFRPDEKLLASGGDDGTVRLWDTADAARPKPLGGPLTGHTGTVRALTFSPDGQVLATAGDDRTARLWDVRDPAHPRQVGQLATHAGGIRALSFGRDRVLATASEDKTAHLHDLTDPANPVRLGGALTGHTGALWSVRFSPDGATLATGGYDKTIRLWRVADPRAPLPLGTPLTGHTGAVGTLAFSADGEVLASGGYDKVIQLWDTRDPARTTAIGGPMTGLSSVVYSVAFSATGRSIAAGSEDGVSRLWTKSPGLLQGHTASVLSTAFRPQGGVLATASEDKTVRLWDVRDLDLPQPLGRPLSAHTETVWTTRFSPDGTRLATAGDDRVARLWDVRDPAHPVPLGVVTGHTAAVRAVAFSPDGRTLATAGADRTVRLWDITDPVKPVPLAQPLTGHTDIVWSVGFTPDGRTLASAGDRTVRLWDVTDPRHPAPAAPPLGEHTGAVWSMAIHPKGGLLASASSDKTVRLWDISDPRAPVRVGAPLTGHGDTVWSVAFDPAGGRLLSGGYDRQLRLWDVADPRSPHPVGQGITGHADTVWSVAFAPDGQHVASGGNDKTARVWNLSEPEVARAVCASTHGTLTEAQWRVHVPEVPYADPCAP
ncbi:WD40 repeat domain-containing protein, partial [Crossiella equi]